MKKVKILSIDGGGVRGIIPIVVLIYLEKKLKKPLNEVFDVIAGTSTGAIIAGMLSMGYNTTQILDLYLGDAVKKIFKKRFLNKIVSIIPLCPKYDCKNIEEVLQDIFKDKTIYDGKTHLVIPADNWSLRQGKVFSSLSSKDNDFKLWEVVRCSTSAETFFKSYKGFFDGGLYANNPTDLAIMEVLSSNKYTNEIDDMFVLSLGTGSLTEYIPTDKLENFNLLDFLKHVMPEVMDRIVQKTHDLLHKILPKTNYYRFQLDCPDNLESMDNVNDDNLQALKKLAEDYIKGAWKEDLDNVVAKLGFVYVEK